jgi:enamine deaminase RidA (YjgF/YER057c/UK114 family)
MQTNLQTETRISHCNFSTAEGLTEIYITATSRDDASFTEALNELKDAYISVLNDLALNGTTLQFTRIYVSDAANEYQILLDSDLYGLLRSGVISVIEQRPLCGPISLLSCHMIENSGSLQKECVDKDTDKALQSLYTHGQNYDFLWTAHNSDAGKDSYSQTENIFSDLSAILQKKQMNLQNNTLRTWIYVRDIDNNYEGMVVARRELFSRIGLTNENRYIASTGIEGKSFKTESLVSMDSLSIGNLKEEQIVRMEAPENLSSTICYGVTFERGLKIRFGDRAHLHISGTASIDCDGEIMYLGDIRGQTERTIDNIEALLRPHGAILENMCYIILYLRNRKHFQFIQDILAVRIPASVPLIPVEGAVCRPGWLIEMEGMAVTDDSTSFPPFC